MEEELRLTYVAMTRAKDFLYVLWPMRFYARNFPDNHVYAQLCRFFAPEVLATMDRLGYDESGHKEDEPIPDIPNKGIMAKIKSMWD